MKTATPAATNHTPSLSGKPRASDFLIASKKCELASLERFLQMGQLVLSIGNLIHTLQRERGASNVFLGSGGMRFSAELSTLVADSRERQQVFEQDLTAIRPMLLSHPANGRLLTGLAAALHGLETLDQIRDLVRRQAMTPVDAIQGYIDRIQHLISVVFEAAETVADPAIAGVLVAMVNLIQGKEMAGQERAAGSLGFSRGGFDQALSQHMVHLIDAQERHFEVFARFADRDSIALWKQGHEADWLEQICQLRGLACSVGRYKSLEPGLADRWFALVSARIDHLKTVEDCLEQHFHRRCVERYTEARNALVHEETLMASLGDQGQAPAPMLVICNEPAPASDNSCFRTEGLGPLTGRSLFDLVQAQAERLEQLNEELQQAKDALEDRRTLEKAVLLLMKHQQISNDEAHKQLRKLAMDQGRKLSDVARSVIAMTDLISSR